MADTSKARIGLHKIKRPLLKRSRLFQRNLNTDGASEITFLRPFLFCSLRCPFRLWVHRDMKDRPSHRTTVARVARICRPEPHR